MAEQPLGSLEAEIERVRTLGIDQLRPLWRTTFGSAPPPALTKDLLARSIVWHIQEATLGGLDRAAVKLLTGLLKGGTSSEGKRRLKAGTVLVREYQGERHTVTVVPEGFVWRETTYRSLSTIARAITGTTWNGPRFFGLRPSRDAAEHNGGERAATGAIGGFRQNSLRNGTGNFFGVTGELFSQNREFSRLNWEFKLRSFFGPHLVGKPPSFLLQMKF